MHWKRILTLVTIGGGVAALVTSAATTGRRRVDIVPEDSARSKSAETSGAALAAEIVRLRERLHPTTTPQAPPRNLFQFHARSAARAIAPAPPAAHVVEAPPLSLSPAMKLIGIASDPGDQSGAMLRTAIISGSGDLFLVKEGETVMSRYRVARISDDVVELTDIENATTVRLALK